MKELGTGASKHWEKMRKLLDWFRKNNAKAIHGTTRLNYKLWRALRARRFAASGPKTDQSTIQVVSHPTPKNNKRGPTAFALCLDLDIHPC